MKRQFLYGAYKYEYELELSTRKTLNLAVEPSGEIILRAPQDVSITEIEKFLIKKWRWLERQLNELRRFDRVRTDHNFVSGESFYYLGRQYMLLVNKGDHDNVTLAPGKINVTSSRGIRESAYTKIIVRQWYRRRQRIIFEQQFIKALSTFDYDADPKLKIIPMVRRWGSYTKNNIININSRLIEAPSEAIYYVLVHELCHVANPHHDDAFYRELSRRVENWQKVKEKLEAKYG